MLEACGSAEKRSDNITQDMDFIYASDTATCGELWKIHEYNKIQADAVNKRLKQIRNGAKW